MTASISAELTKFGRRPATWIVGILFAAALVFFGYILNYSFFSTAPSDGQAGVLGQDALEGILPESLVVNMLANFTNYGSALALVIGALAIGSEYGWDTFKVTLTQRPSRLGFFAGKFVGIGVVLAIITAVMLAVSALASYIIAAAEGESTAFPGIGELIQGLAAGWLILVVFAALGVVLATLFRGTALAIGLGLIYLLVLESLLAGFAQRSERVEAIARALPFKNSSDLIGHFGEVSQFVGAAAPGAAVEPARALITLVIYAVVFLAIAMLLFRTRDVT